MIERTIRESPDARVSATTAGDPRAGHRGSPVQPANPNLLHDRLANDRTFGAP
jgi:hypothetical protein